MDFAISEKMKTILGMIDEFVDKELIPMEPEFLTKPCNDLAPVFEEKRKIVKQMELWAPNHPQELGGMGLDLVEHGLVSEALGRSPLGHYVFGCQAPDAGNIEILHLHGTPEQQADHLRPTLTTEHVWCQLFSEPDAGSDLGGDMAAALSAFWRAGCHCCCPKRRATAAGMSRSNDQRPGRENWFSAFRPPRPDRAD